MKKVAFEIVRSDVNTWQNLFEQAADLATSLGPDRVINISHSSDGGSGVVCIWYWADKDERILGLDNE